MAKENTALLRKRLFKFFTNFFPQKWEREVEVNLAAIEEAQERLQEVSRDDQLEEHVREEAQQLIEQLESSKAYYDWLRRLAHSVHSGEIFDYIPIEQKEK